MKKTSSVTTQKNTCDCNTIRKTRQNLPKSIPEESFACVRLGGVEGGGGGEWDKRLIQNTKTLYITFVFPLYTTVKKHDNPLNTHNPQVQLITPPVNKLLFFERIGRGDLGFGRNLVEILPTSLPELPI